MKTIILTIFTGLILNQVTYSQKNMNGALLKSYEEVIDDADKLKKETQKNLPDYKALKKETGGSGLRTVYKKKDGEVVLIVLDETVQNVKKSVSYYYKKGQFVLSEQIWRKIFPDEMVKHEKFYADNGKLIAWIKTDNSKTNPGSAEFQKVDRELNSYAAGLIAENEK